MINKKLFVGGYYDERIFRGEEFEGKTPFSKNINTYTLEEVLKLAFVENVVEWYEEQEDQSWSDITTEEKIKAILNYTQDDEIASLLYFDTEEKQKTTNNKY